MLEAMYCDTPVITANTTCLPEIAGPAALLVDPLSETAICEGMENVYKDPSLVASLMAAGRQQRLLFSWDRAAEETYQALVELARRSKQLPA